MWGPVRIRLSRILRCLHTPSLHCLPDGPVGKQKSRLNSPSIESAYSLTDRVVHILQAIFRADYLTVHSPRSSRHLIAADFVLEILRQGENDDPLARFGADVGVQADDREVGDRLDRLGQQLAPLLEEV